MALTGRLFGRLRPPAIAVALWLGATGCHARSEQDVPRLTPQSPDAPLTACAGVLFTGDWSYFEGHNRWMGHDAQLVLPNRRWSAMHLGLVAWVPTGDLGRPSTIVLTLDGHELDRFQAGGHIEKDYIVPASKRGGQETTTLALSTVDTVRASDGRELGVAVSWLVWEPHVTAP